MQKLQKDDFKEEKIEEKKKGVTESLDEEMKQDEIAQKSEFVKQSYFARNASSEEDMGYRSMENISSDSLDGDLNLSDCEDFGSIRAKNKKEKKQRRRG